MKQASPLLRRGLWMSVCFGLSLALHTAPVWFLLFGQIYDPPRSLEIDLQALQSYRERIFRELARSSLPRAPAPLPIQISMVSKSLGTDRLRLGTHLSEADLHRARIVQTAMHSLWDQMYCTQPGQALVRLDILADGQIGSCAVTRLRGNAEFQAFLATFLNAFQTSYGGQAGPGTILNLECEFVVKPGKHFTQRSP